MVRVRFAPSPTGIPHIGNTRTALYNYLFAKKNQGKFILRIEDTDRDRLVPESLSKILEILKFVGINWDEGPQVGGRFGPYVQSKRLKIYQKYAQSLVKKKKAYFCFCTVKRLEKLRKAQQKSGKQPRYDRLCLGLASQTIAQKINSKTPHVIRLLIPESGLISWHDLIQGKIEFKTETIDDQIILKSDGFPTYHLGVVVDDHLMQVSHVLRGAEWISSTPKQILLYQGLKWPLPHFGHFSVILGPDKAKLSKRHGAKSALDYRDEGYLVEALVSFMVYLGWSYQDNSQLLSLKQLTKYFDLKKVQKANPIFDLSKLNYFNGKAIRTKSNQELLTLLKQFIPHNCSPALAKDIIPLIKDRLVKLSDFAALSAFFYQDIKLDKKLLIKQSKKAPAEIVTSLKSLQATYAQVNEKDWTAKELESLGRKLVSQTGWTPKELFMTLRVALTSEIATPPLFDTMQVLSKKLALKRLNHAQKIL